MPELNRYLMKQIALEGDFGAYTTLIDDMPVSPRRLENLGKINVFVGANNSGKSRLIRNLVKSKELLFEPPDEALLVNGPYRDIGAFKERFGARLHSQFHSPAEILRRTGLEERLAQFGKLNIKGLVCAKGDRQSELNSVRNVVFEFSQRHERAIHGEFGNTNLAAQLADSLEALDLAISYENAAQNVVRVYIPTLRSLRDLGTQDAFKDRTGQDYQIPADNIFTGQSLYADVEALLRGNLGDREALRQFEEWLAVSFFEGKPVALIPKLKHTTLTVKIGDEHEKPIHELGDGIQSLLILTFKLFRNQDRHLLAFIEEPELFLHPWLQRVFLETLSTRFPKHQYFLTTHSNHFLDLTLDLPDVSVFTLEKQVDQAEAGKEKPSKFFVRQVSRGDRKPLELLGVRNSSVFLSNCTIWVEGITDRRYIAHWLKLYQAKQTVEKASNRVFKEDLHYSFVEYGGGNITHFSFLDSDDELDSPEKGILVDRLCGKLFLITDSDGDKKKLERKEKLQQRLGDRYFCLPAREIENLVKPEVLQKTLEAYGEEAPPLFTHKSYLSEKLGKVIDEKLADKRKRKGSYADEYGVLKGKVLFCERAIAATAEWSDVSEEAQNLVIKVYQFIADMNPR